MEAPAEAYSNRFAGIQVSLTREVNQGMNLIKELLEELDTTKALLKQTTLDLENECDGRRRLQEQLHQSRESKFQWERRPFIVAVIDADADGYVFHERFVTKGEKGGEDAADALLVILQQQVRKMFDDISGVDILVRAFANVSGLGAALERHGRLKDSGQLRAFTTGFSSRQAFFDFVDVGSGKERADFKVRESVKFFSESFQCKHILLACGHDSGYAPFLGQFVSDKMVADRITLVEGSQFSTTIKQLGLKTTSLGSIFSQTTQAAVTASSRTPAGKQNIMPPPILLGADGTNSIARSIEDDQPVYMVPGTYPAKYRNTKAMSHRLGPVLTDSNGRRVDKGLHVSEAVLERMRKGHLCYWLFLRGSCVQNCGRSHSHRPLVEDEFDALWSLARQGRCYKSRKADSGHENDCADAMCVYGHLAKDK